jgi:acyl-coenzyme A thioesterase PaaI-like protein
MRYGVCTPEQMFGLTGREMLEKMLAGEFPAPPIAQTLDFALVEIGDGVAVFEGRPGPHLLNPLGSVHGGWAMTLAVTPAKAGVSGRECSGTFLS